MKQHKIKFRYKEIVNWGTAMSTLECCTMLKAESFHTWHPPRMYYADFSPDAVKTE